MQYMQTLLDYTVIWMFEQQNIQCFCGGLVSQQFSQMSLLALEQWPCQSL